MAIKNDKLTEEVLTELYRLYEDKNVSVDSFKAHCVGLIEMSKQPEHPVKRDILRATNKSIIIFKANSFIMAGHGLGVI